MNANLQSDFNIDRDNKMIVVKREFSAGLTHVWAAWTEQQLLDQWWAPKPWKSVTKSMEFKPGGRRLYAMEGPDGEQHWAIADFTSVTPKSNFQVIDAFSDEHGNINEAFGRAKWNVDFEERNGTTLVTITIKFDALSDLEKHIEMGFREGFLMALGNLDEVLGK